MRNKKTSNDRVAAICKTKHDDLLTAQNLQEFTAVQSKSKLDPLNTLADLLAKVVRNLGITFDLQTVSGQKIPQYQVHHMEAIMEAMNTETTLTLIINKSIDIDKKHHQKYQGFHKSFS